MYSAPETMPIELPTFHADISLPYTLTPGRAAGTFLAEVKNKRIIGSRFASGMVVAPAEDFSSVDGEEPESFVEAPQTGVLTAFTRVDGEVIGFIKLDGCDNEFPHKILADLSDLAVGQRVEAEWQDGVEESITAIKGFRLAPDAPEGAVKPAGETEEPLGSIKYALSLPYEHAYGPYYGRMFDEIRENGRVMGVRCTNADVALLPPREIDDISHKKTGTWKTCADTGTIRGCSIINMEFVGQTREPPYVYAEIVLDGASTRLIHMIEIDDVEDAKKRIKPGTRVRAIWTEGERKGSMSDIERFEVIDE
ncbi:MAG: OB-fold domain-containing protein [Novosphingobium sp.]|nr:OB-fold domain-containing protein [Novosphingobium sp.]